MSTRYHDDGPSPAEYAELSPCPECGWYIGQGSHLDGPCETCIAWEEANA